MIKRITTLVLVYDDKKILLGMKKRGFGEGKWNGFGGKVKRNELIKDAARRELLEEACLKIRNSDILKKRGLMNFSFDDKPDEIIEVNVFSISNKEIVGEPKETEEMSPRWFEYGDIPFKNMWIDDIHWMPLFLAGKNFFGEFHFTADGNSILKKKLEIR